MQNTTASGASPRLVWNGPYIRKLMLSNGIRNRQELAQYTKVPQSTVYAAFDQDWAGEATAKMLAVIASSFGTKLDLIVKVPAAKTKLRKIGVK